MRYLYNAGDGDDEDMHIELYGSTGNPKGKALCGIDKTFNRSINAPFSLGRKVCAACLKAANA